MTQLSNQLGLKFNQVYKWNWDMKSKLSKPKSKAKPVRPK